SKDAGEQRAQRSTSAVYSEGVQRVVIAKFAFYRSHHKEAEDPGQEADQQGREWFYKSGCRGYRDKAPTAPEMPPSMLGLPCLTHSANNQPSAAAAAAK